MRKRSRPEAEATDDSGTPIGEDEELQPKRKRRELPQHLQWLAKAVEDPESDFIRLEDDGRRIVVTDSNDWDHKYFFQRKNGESGPTVKGRFLDDGTWKSASERRCVFSQFPAPTVLFS